MEMQDYVSLLREGIFEAFTGIVQGFKVDGKGKAIQPYAEMMLYFINVVGQDPMRTEAVSRCAAGLLGYAIRFSHH
jgi:importin subunit beta-1